MRRFPLVVLLGMLAALPASAQPIPIHGHPQKAVYASPAEWPLLSAQQHWAPANALAGTPFPAVAHPVLFDLLHPTLGHVHVNCTYPLHGEVKDQKFTVDCSLMLFHMDAILWGFAGHEFSSVVWADTGTSTPPIMKGDPAGLKQWNVKVTIDPRQWLDPTSPVAELNRVSLHGWSDLDFFVRAYLMNGGVLDTTLWVSSYSVMDVTAKERMQPQQSSIPGMHVAAECTPSSGSTTVGWGEMFVDLHGPLPIDPIAKKWTNPVLFYNYTGNAAQMIDGFFEQRHDPDLHTGKLGTIVQHIPAPMQGHFGDDTPVVFDPVVMGSGVHRVMLSWNQPVAPETDSCLLVVNVPVDPNAAPPPATCQDPTAPNVGGPLPCLPPVIVTPTWTTQTGVFQQNIPLLQFRFCPTPTTCEEYVKK